MSGWPTLPLNAENGDAGALITVGNSAPPPTPTPLKLASPRLRLEKLSDVKRELARLYREARRGEISTQTATRLAYLLNMMATLIEAAELEKRVELLQRPDRA